MSESRDKMVRGLQRIVVPELRRRGFTGSLPHLRKIGIHKVDLITFQFDRHGGGFIIEIAQGPVEGFETPWGKRIAPKSMRAWDFHPDQRMRLKPSAKSGTGGWFRFDVSNAEKIAESVLPFLEEADAWFSAGTPVSRPIAD